jgi:hypothetical protein
MGSVAVGLTELEIEVPILVKNLLNSSAIEGGSEICFPSTTIFFDFCAMFSTYRSLFKKVPSFF